MFDWLLTPNNRKVAAFLALLGGAVVMTTYAVAVLYLVRGYAHYAFWLGLAAHVQVALILTGFIALFVKRRVKAGRGGIEVEDIDDDDPPETP